MARGPEVGGERSICRRKFETDAQTDRQTDRQTDMYVRSVCSNMALTCLYARADGRRVKEKKGKLRAKRGPDSYQRTNERTTYEYEKENITGRRENKVSFFRLFLRVLNISA